MPARRICSTPGCGIAYPGHEPHCPTHQHRRGQADNQRRVRHPRRLIYNDWRWRGPNGTRVHVLARDNHTCRRCGNPGRIAGHIRPVLELIANGLDPFNADLCATLCHPCSGLLDGGRGNAARTDRQAAHASPTRPGGVGTTNKEGETRVVGQLLSRNVREGVLHDGV